MTARCAKLSVNESLEAMLTDTQTLRVTRLEAGDLRFEIIERKPDESGMVDEFVRAFPMFDLGDG